MVQFKRYQPFLFAVVLIFQLLVGNPGSTEAQVTLPQCLANNHFSFDLATGFDSTTAILLKNRLTGYKLILQAEGGSHSLKIYSRLPFLWIKFLQEQFGLSHFFPLINAFSAYGQFLIIAKNQQ